MKTKVETLENSKLKLEIIVEEEEMKAGMDRAVRELSNKVKIPGFRKGKVPRTVIEARLGKGAILEEALETILPEAYAKAIEEHEIKPLGNPEINIVEADPEKPLTFEATVQLEPEPELGQYKEVEAEKQEYDVTDEDVNLQVEKLRERHASMVTVEERAVENGDHVVIDFKGFLDGEAFEGGSAEGYSLEIGSNSFIPGFEEQIVGAEANEERDITVSFPDDYHAEHLAGKEVVFKVTVHEIKQKMLPALDDEFAKTAGEFDTLQELMDDLKNNLKESVDENIKRNFENSVLTKVVENAKVDVPEIMIEDRVDRMIERMEDDLKRQGLSMEDYQKYLNKTDEEMREEMKPNAEREVRTELILKAVAKVEGIEATEEDINGEIERIAEIYSQDVESVRSIFAEQGTLPLIARDLQMKKALTFLTESAKPIAVKAEEAEEAAAVEEEA